MDPIELFPDTLGIADPARLGAFGAMVATVLVALLYVQRRRVYLLQWAAGWALFTLALVIAAGSGHTGAADAALFGLSRFLSITAALCFASSAPTPKPRGWPDWRQLLFLVPILGWCVTAPLLLAPAAAVLPGYLLSSALLASGGAAFLRRLRAARQPGTGLLGGALVLAAVTQAWIGVSLVLSSTGVLPAALMVINGLLFLSAALGMHLLVFEEMTLELQAASRRLQDTRNELRELAITDELTGCHNRRFFHEVIGREIQRQRRYGGPLSLLFVDIDRFKEVNDTLGHEAGDRLLTQVALFLERNIRETDYLFRWGGDEFLVLLFCRLDQAREKGNELRKAFPAGVDTAWRLAEVGLSVGCSEITPRTDDIMALIRTADEEMYRNKQVTKHVPHG